MLVKSLLSMISDQAKGGKTNLSHPLKWKGWDNIHQTERLSLALSSSLSHEPVSGSVIVLHNWKEEDVLYWSNIHCKGHNFKIESSNNIEYCEYIAV